MAKKKKQYLNAALSLTMAGLLSVSPVVVLAEDTEAVNQKTGTDSALEEISLGGEVTEEGLVIEYFLNPDTNSKPMARMWFPDAGAGEDENDLIQRQITELAEKGFGGVEVAMLADGVNYGNEAGRTYGWGTENWRKLLKKVLAAAETVDGGFQVDMTISAHWPPAFNTIDPNDAAANKELSYSVTKVTLSAVEEGALNIELPEQKTSGPVNSFTGSTAYPGFLFKDELISAALVQIADIETVTGEDGEETQTYVFDFSTLTPMTDMVKADSESGYAAGIPDKETAEKYGWDYEEICEAFGPEPDGELVNNNGKADEDYDRARMADWQDAYVADISSVADVETNDEEEAQVGDYIVLSAFQRGTGQAIPGGRIMHNTVFVTSYWNEQGTRAVTDYWNQMFADDPELLEMMQANPGYIFEDSIESSSVSSYWAAGLGQDIAEDYEYKDIMAIVAASRYTGSGFGGSTLTEFYKFANDDGLSDGIYEDYNTLLADTYVKYRVGGVTDWANETMGWGFRGQTYHLPGMEISQAASVVDVPECDNMSKGDGIRYQAGTKNVADKEYLTMEAITGPTMEFVTLDDVLTELGQNYSDGVTRAILHGTPYGKTFNGYNGEWPGWIAFGYDSFGSAYTYRAAFWDDMDTATGYMSRIQAVLQHGTAKIDLAVLVNKENTFDFEGGNRFQNLLDSGYSYNLLSEATLKNENAYVEENQLAPEGPAYKALIMDEVSTFSVESMDKILAYAEAGLPVILYASPVDHVYGSAHEEDAVLTEKLEQLKSMEKVVVTDTPEGIQEALAALEVAPYAQYDMPQLETTMYTDAQDGTNYYYMFNNAYPDNNGMMGNDQASYYKGEENIISDVQITLKGSGVPYVLDPMSGEVLMVEDYSDNGDGAVTFTMDELYGGDSVIYCVTEDTQHFPSDAAVEKKSAQKDAALNLTDEKWNLVLHSYSPGGDENDPSISQITDVKFGEQSLVKWAEIEASEEQLETLGVEDMKYVSGVGEYSITFELPDGWNEIDGAYLDVTYGKDQIGTVTINGNDILADNITDRMDLGGYLKEGENELTVKLSTTLYARMYAENSGYADKNFGMGTGFMQPADPDAFYNGLLSAELVPYVID